MRLAFWEDSLVGARSISSRGLFESQGTFGLRISFAAVECCTSFNSDLVHLDSNCFDLDLKNQNLKKDDMISSPSSPPKNL